MVRVGPYDEKETPAVMIFPDANCSGIPKSYFFNPDDEASTTFYASKDLV